MTWQERVKESITLVSPGGAFYQAKWRGNSRSLEKKLGVFNYPNVAGSIVQDLDTNSYMYPITIYFDDSDHDQTADEFIESCKDNGLWEVDHPVKGAKLLQLIDVTEVTNPVENGAFTEFQTNWIEPITDQGIISLSQLEDTIQANVDDINGLSASQLARIIQDAESKVAAVFDTVDQVTGFVGDAVAAVASTVATVENAVASIQRGIQDTLTAVILDPLKLAGQVQNLIQLPGQIITDFKTRFQMYENMVDDIFGLFPDDDNVADEALNTVLSQEVALAAVLAIVPVVGATSEFKTRAETIEALNDISALFDTITTRLDTVQIAFTDNYIDHQYFSQSDAYNAILKQVALSNQLLLRRSYDLTTQRTIKLKVDKTPARITLEEYKDIGQLDLFIESNNLSGDDVLLLRAGREVTIYG